MKLNNLEKQHRQCSENGPMSASVEETKEMSE